jgi:hypothetical protein
MNAHKSLSITCQQIPELTALASSTCSGSALVPNLSVPVGQLLLSVVTILVGRIRPARAKWGESGGALLNPIPFKTKAFLCPGG